MLIRLLLSIALLLNTFSLFACSCTADYTSLEDRICAADTTGGLVLEIIMTSRVPGENEATFRVVNAVVGTIERNTIILGDRYSSCAWYMGPQDLPGKRFLYFAHAGSLDDGESSLFTCYYWSNIYRMNRTGTQVEYPGNDNGSRTELRYQDATSALKNPACTHNGGAPSAIVPNPLRNLSLSNNPGTGFIQITNPSEVFPEVSTVEVFDLIGKRLFKVAPDGKGPLPPLDIQSFQPGLYLVVIRQGSFRKTLRYVKQ